MDDAAAARAGFSDADINRSRLGPEVSVDFGTHTIDEPDWTVRQDKLDEVLDAIATAAKEMKTADVETLLRSFRSASRLRTEIGRRGDAAYLRMSEESEPGRWAIVATPGDRWVSLEVNGGFSLDHFEEDIDDEALSALISQYVEIGLSYLNRNASGSTLHGRAFPVLTLVTDGGSFELRRSLARDLRELFRFPHRESPER